MYLVGTLKRDGWDSSNPMDEAWVKETITKQDLISAKRESDFSVINLSTLEYFNPDTNSWIKIQTPPTAK